MAKDHGLSVKNGRGSKEGQRKGGRKSGKSSQRATGGPAA